MVNKAMGKDIKCHYFKENLSYKLIIKIKSLDKN